MSKVEDCKLTRVGDLPFDFRAGGCNTFPFGLMICFAWVEGLPGEAQDCHS